MKDFFITIRHFKKASSEKVLEIPNGPLSALSWRERSLGFGKGLEHRTPRFQYPLFLMQNPVPRQEGLSLLEWFVDSISTSL
jgi:hypothetical protein